MSQSALSRRQPNVRSRPGAAVLLFFSSAAALVLGVVWSVSVGAAAIDVRTVWTAVFAYNPELTAHQIIQEVRLPRVVIGAMVGACFAVAGAIMQGMTRNPLASPSIMGLNAGAGFFLVLAFAFMPGTSFTGLIIVSFLGAGFGAALVFGIGSLSRGGLTPVKLALAGAAVAALLSSLTTGLIIYYDLAQDVLFYTAGGVQGARWEQVRLMLPWFALGMLAAIAISRHITVLSLGDEIAVGLGQRTGLVKVAGAVIVLLLDEPTTFLDMAHQLEVLKLLERLNREQGRTIVMVVHDLNHASRYAHHMVAIAEGEVVVAGSPPEVMTPEMLATVFAIEAEIIPDPRTGVPLCIPYGLRPEANRSVGL